METTSTHIKYKSNDNDDSNIIFFIILDRCMCRRKTLTSVPKCLSDVKSTWPNTKRTALHVAARFGYHECISKLVQLGSNIEKKDKDGKTALELAAWKNHCTTIQELVRFGANLKAINAYKFIKTVDNCIKGI